MPFEPKDMSVKYRPSLLDLWWKTALSVLLTVLCIVAVQYTYLQTTVGQTLVAVERDVAMISAQSVIVSGRLAEAIDASNKLLVVSTDTMQVQRGYYRDTASHVKALTRAAAIDAIEFGRLVQKADKHLDTLVASTNETIKSVGQAADEVSIQTAQIGQASVDLLYVATDTVDQVGQLASGPEIKETLTNLSESAKNLERTSDDLATAMGDIKVRVHQLTKPASFTVRVGQSILNIGSAAGGFAAGFFK